MISPSLAKQLKYSGFPQKIEPGAKVIPELHAVPGSRNPKDYITVPSLNELIEALGPTFVSVKQTKNIYTAEGKRDGSRFKATGINAETAVAKLWIKAFELSVPSSDEAKKLALKILGEIKLSPIPAGTFTSEVFKGWNLACQKLEQNIQTAVSKYL